MMLYASQARIQLLVWMPGTSRDISQNMKAFSTSGTAPG